MINSNGKDLRKQLPALGSVSIIVAGLRGPPDLLPACFGDALPHGPAEQADAQPIEVDRIPGGRMREPRSESCEADARTLDGDDRMDEFGRGR